MVEDYLYRNSQCLVMTMRSIEHQRALVGGAIISLHSVSTERKTTQALRLAEEAGDESRCRHT